MLDAFHPCLCPQPSLRYTTFDQSRSPQLSLQQFCPRLGLLNLGTIKFDLGVLSELNDSKTAERKLNIIYMNNRDYSFQI
jgi:hypothetical protein